MLLPGKGRSPGYHLAFIDIKGEEDGSSLLLGRMGVTAPHMVYTDTAMEVASLPLGNGESLDSSLGLL